MYDLGLMMGLIPLVAVSATAINHATPHRWQNIAHAGLLGGQPNQLQRRLVSVFHPTNAIRHNPHGWFRFVCETNRRASCFHPKCTHILHVDLLLAELRLFRFSPTMVRLDRTDSQRDPIFHLGYGTHFDRFVLRSC